jgi:CrcB protein
VSVDGLVAAAAVGLGGSAGALGRLVVDDRIGGRRATLTVNVLGSLALGAVAAVPVGGPVGLAAGTGFCGAFTTFSSFAVGVDELATDGDRARAVAYAAGTLVAALAAVLAGSTLASGLVAG